MPPAYVPDAGGLLANVEAGYQYALDHFPDLEAVLHCSCDVPTITPAIVDAFVRTCLETDHDLYYAVVERSVMETRFPGARRSYARLRDGDFAGGDLLLIRPSLTLHQRELWRDLLGARKNVLQQARLIGLWTLFKLLIRRLSLTGAERRVSKVLQMRGCAVPFPYAEAAMDVDKSYQLEIVRADLESRTAGSAT
jgi:hypothetical protein